MKVIGMWAIIAGHFFPPFNEYLYVFSVPLFFFLSGFLHSRKSSSSEFAKNISSGLIIPTIIIYSINLVWKSIIQIIKGAEVGDFLVSSISSSLLGVQDNMEGGIRRSMVPLLLDNT